MRNFICTITIWLIFLPLLHSQSNSMQGDTIQCLCHVDRIRMFKTHVVMDVHNENNDIYSIFSVKKWRNDHSKNRVRIKAHKEYLLTFVLYSKVSYIGDPRKMIVQIGDERFIYKEDFRSGELGIAIDLDGRYYLLNGQVYEKLKY